MLLLHYYWKFGSKEISNRTGFVCNYLKLKIINYNSKFLMCDFNNQERFKEWNGWEMLWMPRFRCESYYKADWTGDDSTVAACLS